MSSQNHAERAHAKLSASGSSRWLNCPGSIRLERDFPDTTSVFAEEGTRAHEMAEMKLNDYLLGCFIPGTADGEMDYYTDNYVDTVAERYTEALSHTKDAQLLLEQRLDFSEWVPEGFGTGDVAIIADGTMEVIDLKYGKGVKEDADNNPQLRLYGLGAVNAFGYLYDIQRIRMTIIQPRLDHVSTEELTVDELLQWGEEIVKPKAQLAASGEGECHAGEHCRFCKARNICKALAEYNLELIGEDFSSADTLSNEELAEILSRAKSIQNWITDIIGYTLNQAVSHDAKYPGYKLVEGVSRRKYSDEAEVVKALEENGFQEDKYFKPRALVGITEMEKLVGKKNLPIILGDLVIKPPGSPTLVPVSDKRPELSSIASAEADFENEEF